MHDSGENASRLETTAQLIARIQGGDDHAREDLARRFLPVLRQWARGRLPHWARDIADTEDLVQESLLGALDRVEGFEPRGRGSFLAYLRQTLKNRIRDQIRRKRPEAQTLDERIPGGDRSPLENAISRERLEAYEKALAALKPREREAVILRMELGFTHEEVARELDCPSANAARMMVARAIVRLVEVMNEG